LLLKLWLGDPAAIQPLIAALNDKEGDVRGTAAKSLLIFDDHQAVTDTLMSAITDHEKDIFISAALALSWMGKFIHSQPLIDALNNDDAQVRGIAAYGLEHLGDRVALQPLMAALNDGLGMALCITFPM
jgi:HEAT repeat protein